MKLKSTRPLSGLAAIGLALSAVTALRSARPASEPAWVSSIGPKLETRHHHPRMDDDTLLSLTPSDGRFATTMRAWFPLFDRLEARGLVEVERGDGMYVVRRIASCLATSDRHPRAHPHQCG